MEKPTAQNARLRMWSTGGVRWLALDFPDGRQLSTSAFAETWESVVPSILHDAPADVRELMSKPLGQEPQAATSLPICADTISVLRLLRLLEGLDLPTALLVTQGWMQVSLQDRAEGRLDYHCSRVIGVQLMGLIQQPSPILATKMPQGFPEYVDAFHCMNDLWTVDGPRWRAGQSFLGSTCLAFAAPRGYGLQAYLAISDCNVSYPMPEDGGLPKARIAVDTLISHLPKVIANDVALRLAGWDPRGHEIMEIANFLGELEKTLAHAGG